TLLSPALTLGATPAYSYETSVSSGVVQNPNEHRRVGYITRLWMGTNPNEFNADLKVAIPYQAAASPTYSGLVTSPQKSPAPSKTAPTINTAHVVGIIEKFEWSGAVGGAINIDFWVSQENATLIKTLQQSALATTFVKQLGWWIADYDQERKTWYEKSFPMGTTTITGIISGKENPGLDVILTPSTVQNAPPLYKVSM